MGSLLQFVLLEMDDPAAEETKILELALRGRGDFEGHLMSHGLGSAESFRMQFTRSAAENIEELAFLPHFGIMRDKSTKRIEMRFDAESLRRRKSGKLFRFDVTELVNPVVELVLLLGGEFEEAAIGARFHKVSDKWLVVRSEFRVKS